MKYPPIRTITCKCDACNNEVPHDKDHLVSLYDPFTKMVVCPDCQDDYKSSAELWGDAVNFIDVPEDRICYDEREYEPDYDND